MARVLLSGRQAAAHSRALNAVADLRRGDAGSLSEAARRRGTTVRSIHKYTPSAVRRQEGSRRWQARPGDSYSVTMQVLTVDGVRTMRIQGSRQRSIIGAHWAAVSKFQDSGDETALSRFAGVSVTGRIAEAGAREGYGLQADLLTDTDELTIMSARGELDEIDVYASSRR